MKFGMPLEEAFELVCDNNLSKFVALSDDSIPVGSVEKANWGLGQDVTWPDSVASVEIVKIQNKYYAVGKDGTGKVRKPSTYQSVDLESLISLSA